ncbi:MAG: DUF2012 domain-containing protein [bacterium]
MSKEEERYRAGHHLWVSPAQGFFPCQWFCSGGLKKAALCLILFLSLLSLGGCGSAGKEKKEATVYGFIEGEVTEGVTVTVVERDRELKARTGSSGFYQFDLPDGEYTLTASLDGYLSIPQSQHIVVSGRDGLDCNFLLVKSLKDKALWSGQSEGEISSSPAVDRDGTVYVGSSDSSVYAFSPTGGLKWSYSTKGAIHSSPAIDQRGVIYVGSTDHSLYALDPADGKQHWSYKTGGAVQSSPAIDDFGKVYIGSDDSSLHALSPEGKLLWSYKTGGEIQSSPAIDANGVIYVGSNDMNLYALSPDGKLRWKFPTRGVIRSSPVIGTDTTIYIGSCDHTFYALNPEGKQKWAHSTGGEIHSSCALSEDGTIYFGCCDHCLYALAQDGTRKWSYKTNSAVSSSPALDQRKIIYFGCEDGTFYALTPDGTVQAAFLADGGILSSPCLSSVCLSPAGQTEGRIYIGSNDRALYALANPALDAAGSVWPMFRKGSSHKGAMPLNSLCSISGRVSGAVSDKVTVSLSSTQKDLFLSTETSTDGTFTFNGVHPGAYTLSADREGYSFTPRTIDVMTTGTQNGRNNFTAYAACRVSGTMSGAVLKGVTISVRKGSSQIDSTVTGELGKFDFSLPRGASYTLTPLLDGYAFIPGMQTVELTQNREVNFISTLKTCVISGVVSGDVRSGVTVYLDGNTAEGVAVEVMTTTRANGSYEFTVYRGSYTITPSLSGYSFTPGNRQITIGNSGSISGNHFTASDKQAGFILSGTITGAVKESVTLAVSGDSSATAVSDEKGEFSFQLPSGHYILKASRPGYTFSPPQREITIQDSDCPNNDFSSSSLSSLYTISGTISGEVQGGVILTLRSGGANTVAEAQTDDQGNFSLSAPDGSYALTPVRSGCRFEPESVSITIHGANSSNLHFTCIKFSGVEKWAVGTGGRIYSSLSLGSDGTIYAGSYDDGKIYAVNPDGSIKWTFTTLGAVFTSPTIDPNRGALYIGSSDRSVYGITLQGEKKWATALPDAILSTAALGADGTLYIGCNDGCLYALNAADGQKKWSSPLENMVSSPAIGPDGTIYVGAGNWTGKGQLYALDPGNGERKWIASVYTLCRPAIGPDGTIYVGSGDKKIYALYPATGNTKWSYLTKGEVLSSPSLGPDGTIYVGSDDAMLYALNPNGTLKWSATTEGKVRSSACIGPDGTVYIGSNDCYLYAFDSGTGEQKWRFFTKGGAVTAIPVIGTDNTVYIGSQNWRIYAIHGGQ